MTEDVKKLPTIVVKPTDSKRTEDTSQTYIPIPGVIVKVILEFPELGTDDLSGIIELDDVSTLAYSLYRVKVPVIPLGQIVQDGFGIGTRAVAGTMIRSIFMKDRFSDLQTKMYLASQDEIRDRLNGIDKTIPSGVPMKDQISFMKDDLTYFNIHAISVTEQIKDLSTGEPFIRQEMILGCTILNNGQTYSIEDLVTESSFTFQAKAVRTSTDPSDYNRGYSSSPSIPSISSLFKG